MPLSNPRLIYSVHSFTAINRTTGLPYGTAKVLQGSSFQFSGELVSLRGGSQRYAYAVEDADITAEISLNVSQYEDFLMELFLGNAPTSNAAETGASVTSIANKQGTSIAGVATGIISVGVKSGSESEVKFARYTVKAVTTTTVDVYASTDADFGREGDLSFQNDALKITASPLTITQDTAVEIPGTGLELTGGSGTIGMTADDTATFNSRPINTKSMDVVIGGINDIFPEFEAVMMAKKRGNGELFEITAYRCKGVGQGFGLERNAWSQSEITAEAFYDEDRSGVAAIRHVTPTTAN